MHDVSAQRSQTRHRPLGIWLLGGFMLLAGCSALLVDAVAIRANFPNGQLLTYTYPELMWLNHLMTWVLNGILLVAGVLLLRLQSRVVPVLSVYIGGLLLSQAWLVLTTDWLQRYGIRGMVKFGLGVFIFVAIRTYAQRTIAESRLLDAS